MQTYLNLMQHVLDHGHVKTDRTGTGTRSVFGWQMRFDLEQGFPVLTTKKLHLRSIGTNGRTETATSAPSMAASGAISVAWTRSKRWST